MNRIASLGPDSDVSVLMVGNTITCQRCALLNQDNAPQNREIEIVDRGGRSLAYAHFATHRAGGHQVPGKVFRILE